jgi:malate dehydrogenase
VPIASATTINGIPADRLIAKDKLDAIIARTRTGGGEIVNLMGTSAYYAPAAGAIVMAEAYLLDQKRLLACAALLSGQYGYRDFYLGVPVVLGAGGIEKIVDIGLTPEERAALEKSAGSVRKVVDVVKAAPQ